MAKYRIKKIGLKVYPKIFVWSHTQKAEIEYFLDFKHHFHSSQLMPKKNLSWEPHKLLKKVIKWKNKNINKNDHDQVWCVFDIDDFYKNNKKKLMKVVYEAIKNNIKIAYVNECFELWILLHFFKPLFAIKRGRDIEQKIRNEFKKHQLGKFVKNQKVFDILFPFQNKAIKNSQSILPEYDKINWDNKMSTRGNPSTSIHFLIKEINSIIGNHCEI